MKKYATLANFCIRRRFFSTLQLLLLCLCSIHRHFLLFAQQRSQV
jgi:hypothetical protein